MQSNNDRNNIPQEVTHPDAASSPSDLEKDDLSGDQHQVQQQLKQSNQGVRCPNCGTINDAEAVFCASCGSALHATFCPHCGTEIDPETDYCEACHHYISKNVCSFCGSALLESDAYCPECGSPRGGIVCPVCHTLNEFSFCKKCGTPLTEEAKSMQSAMKQDKGFMELIRIAEEYTDLDSRIPYNSSEDKVREQLCEELRMRVLTLLAEDEGHLNAPITPKRSKRIDSNELKQIKDYKLMQISMLLDKFETPPMPTSAKARNYAMATKPIGLRLGWMCNYKHALHASPCGCAKPQLGGKWVVLNGKNESKITDDTK